MRALRQGVEDASCVLVIQIGRPVDHPQLVDIRLVVEDDPLSSTLRTAVADIARSQLGQVGTVRDELLAERLTLY